MVILGIDEMSVVVKAEPQNIKRNGWDVEANELRKLIENNLNLSDLWKEGIVMKSRIPAGYNVGRMYGEEHYLFCIAYNKDRSDMGVIIKMSASGLSFYKKAYKEKYGERLSEYEIVKKLDEIKGTVRLSRIDCYADFINEGLCVDQLYSGIKANEIIIQYGNGRKNTSRLSSYENDSVVDTFYVGTRVKNSKGVLRVYNKKKEQIEKYGVRYYDAIKCEDWVRLEAQFLGKYAHDLTNVIRNCQSEEDLGQMVASSLIDRYSFYDPHGEKYHYITRKLMEIITTKTVFLSSPSPRNASLEKTFNYIIEGSGLMSLLYKIKRIYGEDGVNYVFGLLFEAYDSYKPNEDVISWIEKYHEEYMEHAIEDVIKRKR